MKTLLRLRVEQWLKDDPEPFVFTKDDYEIDLFDMSKSFRNMQEQLNKFQEANERNIWDTKRCPYKIVKTVKTIHIENHVE